MVFWHYLLLHGAGINRVPGTIRQSVIYDYNLSPTAKAELEQKRAEDGTEDAERCLWYGWAPGLQQARGSAPRL